MSGPRQRRSRWPTPAVALLLPLSLGACLSNAEVVQKRREITIRPLDVEYRVAFAAALTVLQDRGFVIEVTDNRSGLIRGLRSGSLSATTLLRGLASPFDGDHDLTDDLYTYEVSVVLTPYGPERTELRAMILRQEARIPEPPGVVTRWVERALDADVEEQDLGPETLYDRETYARLFDAIALEAARVQQLGAGSTPGFH